MDEQQAQAPRRRGRPRAFDRAAAVRSAMEVFWTHGYRDASIDVLTSAMGIAPPSLYAAFGSKADLFREAAEAYQTTDAAAPMSALDAPTARGAVEGLLSANADLFTRQGGPRGCLLTRAALTCPADEAEVARYLAESFRARTAAIERALERATRRDELLPGTPISQLAAYVDTIVQGMAVRAAEGAGRRDLHGTVALAMRTWDVVVEPRG